MALNTLNFEFYKRISTKQVTMLLNIEEHIFYTPCYIKISNNYLKKLAAPIIKKSDRYFRAIQNTQLISHNYPRKKSKSSMTSNTE